MSRVYTSDNHFFHKNILVHAKRSHSSIDEMNRDLVSKWNDIIKDRDEVYHVGDMFMLDGNRRTLDLVNTIVSKLKGKKFIIPGNHDKKLWKWINKHEPDFLKEQRIEILDQIHEIKVIMPDDTMTYFVLCHYPMLSWNRRSHKSIQLHGHTHSKVKNTFEEQRRINVGVDAWDMFPVREQDVLDLIYKKDF